jgi:hypothetical protein
VTIDREDLRFCILSILAGATGQKANGVSIGRGLSKDHGLEVSRDTLAVEFVWLDETAEAVVDQDVDGVHILTLTEEGREHLLGLRTLPKVRRPRPDELAKLRALLG